MQRRNILCTLLAVSVAALSLLKLSIAPRRGATDIYGRGQLRRRRRRLNEVQSDPGTAQSLGYGFDYSQGRDKIEFGNFNESLDFRIFGLDTTKNP